MLRWEDVIKVDVKEIVWERVYWIHLDEDGDNWRAVVNMALIFGFLTFRSISLVSEESLALGRRPLSSK
jgi:hypothetical protein